MSMSIFESLSNIFELSSTDPAVVREGLKKAKISHEGLNVERHSGGVRIRVKKWPHGRARAFPK